MPILAYFSWTMVHVPHGDVFFEKNKLLTNTGISQYWARRGRAFKGDSAKEYLLKAMDFDDDLDYGSLDTTVGFSDDSILKEAFCLYDLGVGIALVSLFIAMVHSHVEFY